MVTVLPGIYSSSTLGMGVGTVAVAKSNGDNATDGTYAGDDEPLFTPQQREELVMRRFNPLAALTALTLTSALDSFDAGYLAPAARLWGKIAERERVIATVKPKREEAVALRPWVVDAIEESPEAANQKAVVEAFVNSLKAGHALDRHVTGGFALLVQQMMESVSYRYAVHHLRWAPDAAETIELPNGGGEVPSLKVTCEYVPLEYFEARTGELRFLGTDQGYNGQPLADRQWMTTTGPGLMRAAAIAIYEARLARHDRMNLSEKWGQPAVLGHTTATKNSDAGRAMKTAVTSVASNYRGVIYGSDRNVIEPVWPSASGGGGSTPMKEIMDDVRRELVTLYIGSDLSTVSRGGSEQSVGASVQGDSETQRQQADCQMISETFTTTLVPIVVKWYFGETARVLVKLTIEPPDNENASQLSEAVMMMVDLGAPVPVAPVAKRLKVPIATEGNEAIFKKAASMVEDPLDALTGKKTAINAGARPPDAQVTGKLLARMRDLFGHALAEDLQPLRSAMAEALHGDEATMIERARTIYARLAELGPEIIKAQGSARTLYQILSAAAASGLNPDDRKQP
jgi:hypothetical protein